MSKTQQNKLEEQQCDTGIPRYQINQFVQGAQARSAQLRSSPLAMLEQHPFKMHAFDLKGKGIWENLGTKYFSESKMIIPPEFKLITNHYKVGKTFTPQDIEDMKSTARQVAPERVFMSFIHSINDKDSIVHPCSKNSTGKKKKRYLGNKVCTYPLFTASSDSSDLEQTHLVFYADNEPRGIVASSLLKLYRDYNLKQPTPAQRPAQWYTDAGRLEHWEKVFLIPLMLPNTSVMFNVIPDTPKGRIYLLHWLNNVKVDQWLAVDAIKEPLEEWETDITLDAKLPQA